MSFVYQIFGVSVFTLIIVYWLLVTFHLWQRARLSHSNLQLENQLVKQKVENLIRLSSLPERNAESWSGWRKFRIAKIVQENNTIKSFYLKPHDGKPLPEFLAGQHLTFSLKVPGKSKPVIRCYSLSDNANEKSYYRISIRRQTAPLSDDVVDDGVASCFFHDSVEENDVLDVKAPSGNFYLDAEERGPIVLVGGGIGLTPSLSMLNTLYFLESSRPIFLFYAVRDLSDLIMREHFVALERDMQNLTIHYFFGELDEARMSANRHVGFLTVEKIFDLTSTSINPLSADFYVCGPPPMMDAIVGGLSDNMIDPERIHFESFGPASISTATKAGASVAGSEPRHVEFHVSHKSMHWDVSAGTLLEAAENIGVVMDSGCRAGSCGACLTAILEGGVEYIDQPGTEIEAGSCLPCIAIPTTNLILNA
jgi:ferredoxin-NADP reductase